MLNDLQNKLLDAALTHVPFDGWSDETLKMAAADIGISPAQCKAEFPRGIRDLAGAYHRRGDRMMVQRLKDTNLSELRYSQRVAAGVRFRIEAAGDKEIIRRGMSFFALPQNAGDGAALIWGTADAIWTALGDTSDDLNWYSKRAILSGVYGSTVMFWLGDTSDGDAATWAFLDRRIEDVMRFEKTKARVRENKALQPFVQFTESLFSGIRAPSKRGRDDLPGRWDMPDSPS